MGEIFGNDTGDMIEAHATIHIRGAKTMYSMQS